MNGVRLSCKSGLPWYCRTPSKSWGTRETINGIQAAIWEVFNKHPNTHRLAIEHISAKHGGHLRPHVSHQSGRDVDMGMYFRNQPPDGPKRFLNGNNGKLDIPRTWSLLTALIGKRKASGRCSTSSSTTQCSDSSIDGQKSRGRIRPYSNATSNIPEASVA